MTLVWSQNESNWIQINAPKITQYLQCIYLHFLFYRFFFILNFLCFPEVQTLEHGTKFTCMNWKKKYTFNACTFLEISVCEMHNSKGKYP